MKTPEERAAYKKQWKEKNRARLKAKNAAYYQNNKDKFRISFREWRNNNRDKSREIKKKWRDLNPDKQLLHNAKMRAKKLGIPFDLNHGDFSVPEFCPALGIRLVWIGGPGREKNNAPSLDRVRPALGYVKGNVRVISWRANRIKADGSLEELQMIVDYVKRSQT